MNGQRFNFAPHFFPKGEMFNRKRMEFFRQELDLPTIFRQFKI